VLWERQGSKGMRWRPCFAQVFATDITLSFFTAYYDQEVLITDHKMIAKHYLKCVRPTGIAGVAVEDRPPLLHLSAPLIIRAALVGMQPKFSHRSAAAQCTRGLFEMRL